MSASLEYGTTHGWEKVDIPLGTRVPATEEELRRFDEITDALAQKLQLMFQGYKTTKPKKKVVKKTLSLDAGRMF